MTAIGREKITEAARQLSQEPFIVKPNQGGKVLGVQLFASISELENALESGTFPETMDGVWLFQEKIETHEEHITRAG